MTAKPENFDLSDARDRQTAVGTFERNLVVTAGAGTGKTTLLVDRLVHLILRNPDPLKITEIVALTFTNKAADEIKLRLRERLQTYLAVELDRAPADVAEEKTQATVQSLMALYQLSKGEVDSRIHDALRNLERSDIGTIHSFAATLLRLYPLEAGVDPQFREDEGAEFTGLFDEQWDRWLDQELALASPRAADWRKVLTRFGLDQIKVFAQSLSSELVELRRNGAKAIPATISDWLTKLERNAATLIERHPEDRTNEKLVRAALAVLKDFKQAGKRTDLLAGEYALVADKEISRTLKGWSDEDIKTAQTIVRVTKGLASVNDELAALIWRLLVPYAEAFRERFIGAGHLSFDGLLARARNLVRDDRRVRAELKGRYQSILIDEFQDTDPIQYEILLYLAEEPGPSATDWRQVKLDPGKIFVVGDPKQSIYAFRRADIEAYLEVVERIIKAQNGIECRLTTNFRSNSAILDVVNGAFDTLIRAQDGVQPPYIPIHPAPGRSSAASHMPKVMVRKIISDDNEAIDAETARRLEGQSLARWLKEEVLNKTAILSPRGDTTIAEAKDIAILLRKLTDIHDYLEPLRRHGIRYVVEGERHFYAAKEIIDTVNLLRAVENPYDRLALVGVLRSPLGGLTDQEIYELHRQNLLDYRTGAKLADTTFPATLPRLYKTLAHLHDEILTLPIGAALAHLFATLPMELLAACHFHGEQAVANLQKLRRQAEQLGREGLTTLKAAIRQLEKRVLEVTDESESVLAEDNLDAVRVMSIHKAKGLEFPIVILAGCQSGIENQRNVKAESLFDWSSGLTGLRIGQTLDLAGLYIGEKTRLRNTEEQKRLLYVAMTRAREILVVSCAPATRRGGSFLDILDETVNGAIAEAKASTSTMLGNGKVDIQVVRENLTAPSGAVQKTIQPRGKPNWQPFIDTWARRAAAYEKAQQTTPFLTPTLLKEQEANLSEASASAAHGRPSKSPALVIGALAHGFLQNWDFAAGAKQFAQKLRAYIGDELPQEFRGERALIETELQNIFENFLTSTAYAELSGSKILGREVPLLMPWNGHVMEGVIDLIYERNGLLYLADYKTDRAAKNDLAQGAERYRQQAEIYTQAARQSLRRQVAAFKLIFLRAGEAVEIGAKKNEQLTLFSPG